MEIPGELKSDLQRTLLGPLSFATELYGALIPGSVFLILVCVKRQWATPILTYSLVGYKTKVVLGVLASYIIGKVSLSAIGLVTDSTEWFVSKLKSGKDEPLPTNPTALQTLLRETTKLMQNSWATTFLGGLVGASILSNKSDLYHHYTASQAESSFHMNAGLLLILASLIRGDGQFRVLEAVGGSILLIAGIRLASQSSLIMAGSYGMVLNDYLKSHSPEKVIGTITGIVKFLASLAKVPPASEPPTAAPSPDEKVGNEGATETAKAAAPNIH